MSHTNHPVDDKRPYEKPLLRVIELASDEVLAAGCKTPGTPKNGAPASFPCNGLGCAGFGS